jgi:hypothetical protein
MTTAAFVFYLKIVVAIASFASKIQLTSKMAKNDSKITISPCYSKFATNPV